MYSKNILVLLLIILLSYTGCKDSTSSDNGTPPAIPPQSSFLINFSDFDTTGKLLKGTDDLSVMAGENWLYSAINVGVWNFLVTVGMAVPTASFVEAFNHTPEQQEDGSWIWTYNFNVFMVQYTANLKGIVSEEGVDWEMRISRADSFTDFLWYTGYNNLTLTEGNWLLYNSPQDPTELLEILWTRNLEDETANIKYTNIVPDGEENGGYIFYGTTTDTTYNAFYDIFNKGQNNLTKIEWHLTNKNGRVSDSLYFGDQDWHCWDTNLNNIVCP